MSIRQRWPMRGVPDHHLAPSPPGAIPQSSATWTVGADLPVPAAGGCQLPRLPQLSNKACHEGQWGPHSPLTPSVYSQQHSPNEPIKPKSQAILLPDPNPLTPAETPPTGLKGPLRSVPHHTLRVLQHALLAHLTPATLTSCCPSSRKHQAPSSLRAFALSVPSSGRLSLREPQDSLLPLGYASKRQPLRESISSLLFNMETAPPPRTLSLLPLPASHIALITNQKVLCSVSP